MRSGHEGTPADERFEIRGHLGTGASGAVYEAYDRHADQRVALKELMHVSPGALARFKNEFRALADIHHPNLVRLKELIERDGRWYIVMELIDGDELLRHVRAVSNDPGFDERLLRDAFAGLAEGLSALHAAGILHRDLKPSNVRVTREGRAVLLDFGLITAVDEHDQSTHDAVGTIAYMAPEQAAGQKLGPATDWYAFGASLYEALTGRMPFESGSTLLIALDKQRSLPPHPDTLVRGLPADLCELCMGLLQIAPEKRPRESEVLAVLRDGGEVAAPKPSIMPMAMFAGRDEELSQLARALGRTREGALAVVLVEGESGVGKSELVAEFLRRQQEREPLTVALRGRCYENEQASYKAFDTCIDELADTLRRMGGRAVRMLPAHAPLLSQLFPSFCEVPALPRGALDGVSADPTARRLQGFSALAELLRNLSRERPVILVIDDLQWADSESFRLLRALVEDEARPSMLVLATVRPPGELDDETRSSVDMVRAWRCCEVVSIGGLPAPAAAELARVLLGDEQDASWAGAIAEESRGHPFLLAELVRFARSGEPGSRPALTLEAALAARIEQLPAQVREVLEVVALAGRPHPPPVFARAMREARVDEALTILLGHRLLRARQGQIGCYHDRIRAVAVDGIERARRPAMHRGLAQALAQQRGADPSEEALHWDLAGEPERALEAYERAARRAFDTLAFAHAVRLYTRALALLADRSAPHYASLVSARADALSCAGRCAEAASAYAEAAELCRDAQARLVLRSKTAVKLMQSGNLTAGIDACRALFAELGIRMPRGTLASLLVVFWHRARTRFSMDAVVAQPVVDPRTRLVLDLLHDHGTTLGVVSTMAFLVLSAQYARLALKTGDARYIRRAYASEGWLRNAQGGMHSAAPFFAASHALAARNPDSEGIRAYEAYAEGSALLADWQWQAARDLLEEAERLHVRHHRDDPWALINARYHLGMAWYRMGEHALLARRMDEWIHEAHERQDRFAVLLLTGTGHGAIRHLMRGSVEGALTELDEGLAGVPDEPFSFGHFGHVMLTTQALVYAGGRAAWDRLEASRAAHARAFLYKTRVGKSALLLLRSQAALSACTCASAAERKSLLALVHDTTRRLRRQKAGFTDAFAALYDALLRSIESKPGALELAREARTRFEQLRAVGLWPSLYLEGLLEGGASGAARKAQALDFYASQGWVDPARAVRMSLPGLSG
jgi:tetratricopeptide (TPR) repeat protein